MSKTIGSVKRDTRGMKTFVHKSTTQDRTKEEGVIYVDSYGNTYKQPKIDAKKISQSLENVYLKGALDKLQRLLFNERFTIEVLDKNNNVDESLSVELSKMCEQPDVRLWWTVQRLWRDASEWGPGIVNPVWSRVGNLYTLTKLNRLPPESFSGSGGAMSNVQNRILKGILINNSTGEIEYWQRQSNGRTVKLQNIVMLTDPLSAELGGTPIIIPIIPIVSMLDFSWQGQMQQVNLLGAGGRFFIKVVDPMPDNAGTGFIGDVRYAQTILKNISKNTAYQLRGNMEVLSFPVSDNKVSIETIDALNKLVLDHFSPASSIAKDGTLIGGSSGPEWEMYQSYIRGTHAWIEEACEQLLYPYIEDNSLFGYSIRVTLPSPSVDKSEFVLKVLTVAMDKALIDVAEGRKILMDLGIDLTEKTDDEIAELGQNQEQLMQMAKLVIDAGKTDMDPEHLISQEDAQNIINKVLKIPAKP